MKKLIFAKNTFDKALNMKEKIELDYELKSNSATFLWPLISTDAGLKKWLADDVQTTDDGMMFTWGNPHKHTETYTAQILTMVKKERVRFFWKNEDEADVYWEIKMSKSEIAGNYHLLITDFAHNDEIEDLEEIWNQNIKRLRLATGV